MTRTIDDANYAARVVCPFCEHPRSVRRDGNVVVHKHPGTGKRCFGSERVADAMPRGPAPESPITCAACTGQHSGVLTAPCHSPGCECYCNR